MDVEKQLLGPVVIGMGAAYGYSGSDLTSPRSAARACEVPYLAADGSAEDADPVLELRIHGVGGAPATDNLESPGTLQVAGDGTAGFYRAWYPGGGAARRPRRGGLCWGGPENPPAAPGLFPLPIAFILVKVA